MIKFYDIDENYVKFLQKIDRQIPNIHYSTNNKFVCGVVLKYWWNRILRTNISYNKKVSNKSVNI